MRSLFIYLVTLSFFLYKITVFRKLHRICPQPLLCMANDGKGLSQRETFHWKNNVAWNCSRDNRFSTL